MPCGTEMNASDFGVKGLKFKVMVEQNILQTALSEGGSIRVLNIVLCKL